MKDDILFDLIDEVELDAGRGKTVHHTFFLLLIIVEIGAGVIAHIGVIFFIVKFPARGHCSDWRRWGGWRGRRVIRLIICDREGVSIMIVKYETAFVRQRRAQSSVAPLRGEALSQGN